MPVKILSRLDLPAPFSPMMPTTSLRRTSMEMSWTAVTLLKAFETPVSRSAGTSVSASTESGRSGVVIS